MENKGIYITIGLIAVLVFAVIVIIILSDGRDKKADNQANTTNTTNKINYEEAAEKQMAKPEKGETIAVMHVKNFGDITFKFFEDKAPKAVENFLTHAKEGYYNGVKFHRVIEEFMIQGGDPKGDGTGGESIWGTGFEEEFDDSLVPYRGALCMASAGVGRSSLGSQFFIVQANPDNQTAQALTSRNYDSSLVEQYKKYGGNIYSLYKQYTVFGQVVEGMDVVDSIAKVETTMSSNGEMSSPVEDVIIESIEVKTQE